MTSLTSDSTENLLNDGSSANVGVILLTDELCDLE